ncbi:hypothetical protein B0H19DRAFT_1276582 [Mycena capillaripes]|nr:hypothetical protein B0H19DRAFT_1276582 [Mycena capillaripes]
MPPDRSPNHAREKRVVTQCTPTKRMATVIYHDNCGYSFDKITTLWPFENTTLHARTLARNYEQVKEHDGDCHLNNKKGHVGRKKSISDEDMTEAVERVNAGELIDGEDVRRVMFPTIPVRTVRDSLTRAGLPGHVQRTKPALQPRHIQQREEMYNQFEHWTIPEVFACGVLINSDETKIELKAGNGRHCRGWQSNDLSPIENAWAQLKRKIRNHPRYSTIQSAAGLFELAREIWLSADFIQYVITALCGT